MNVINISFEMQLRETLSCLICSLLRKLNYILPNTEATTNPATASNASFSIARPRNICDVVLFILYPFIF